MFFKIENKKFEFACTNHVLRNFVRPTIAASLEKTILVNISPDETEYHDYILQNLQTEFALNVYNRWKQEILLDAIGHKIHFYILFIDHLFEVTETIKRWKLSTVTWNPLARVFVFISDSSETDWKSRLILQKFLENHMMNVDIIRKSENADKIEVVTWFPFADGSCGTHIQKLEVIGQCDKGSLEKASAFQRQVARPKIPLDMGNCTTLVTGIEWAPFIHHNRRTGRNSGSEIQMMAAISSKLNISVHYKILDTKFRDNMTVINAELENRLADVVIGGLGIHDLDSIAMIPSIAHSFDEMTWCVAVAKMIPRWRNIFAIFPDWFWCFIFAFGYVMGFILLLMMSFDPKPNNFYICMLVALATVVGLPVHIRPLNWKYRFYFMSMVLFGMIFIASFNSFLLDIITHPKFEKQIDTAEKMVSEDFIMTGNNCTAILFEHETNDVTTYIRRQYQECSPSIDDCLSHLQYDLRLAVAISKAHSQNSPSMQPTEMFCFHTITSYPVVMAVRKDFAALPNINSIVQHVFEAGLIQKWERDGQLYSHRKREDYGNIRLSVEHLSSGTLTLMVGFSLAILSFIGEILIFKYFKRTQPTERKLVWVLIEKLIFRPERSVFVRKFET